MLPLRGVLGLGRPEAFRHLPRKGTLWAWASLSTLSPFHQAKPPGKAWTSVQSMLARPAGLRCSKPAKDGLFAHYTSNLTVSSLQRNLFLRARRAPPTARKGVGVDPYAWLRDGLESEITAYLRAENEFTDSVMKRVAGLEKAIFQEMSSRMSWSEESDPEQIGEWLYYMRTENDTPFPAYCRRRDLASPEQVVLDQNMLSRRYSYFDVAQCKLSPCHSMVAYTADTTGEERYTGFVREIETGRELCMIPSVVSIEWAGDGETLFYTQPNHNRRPHRLFRRPLHDDGAAMLVLKEDDDAFFLDVGRTKDERFITISTNSKLTSEVRILPADKPWSDPLLIEPRQRGVEYFVEHCNGALVLVTNAGCDDYKLVQADPRAPRRTSWLDLHVPAPGTKIEDIDVFRRHVVVYERTSSGQQVRILDVGHDASPAAPAQPAGLVQFSPSCGFPHVSARPPARRPWALSVCGDRVVELPGARSGRNIQPGANCDIEAGQIRLSCCSPVSPWQVFDVPLDKGTPRRIREREGLGEAWREEEYECELHWATSGDGAKVMLLMCYFGSKFQVPMTVVHRKDLEMDGSNPALLEVYGAYGQCVETDWKVSRVSLLQRGWVVAMCHVRGGGELGAAWHAGGRGMNKWNSVLDLQACTHALAASGLSSHPRMALHSASAGGLLIGAFLNSSPHLVGAAVAKVPFVDVANTMADPTLALTIPEYDEWGDVNDPQVMKHIRSYSPYDNVKRQRYPPLYVTASYNDTRVGYWEPAKWMARLRERAASDSGPLLLCTEFEGGHFGTGGRDGHLQDVAREYAFLYLALDLDVRAAAQSGAGDSAAATWWQRIRSAGRGST